MLRVHRNTSAPDYEHALLRALHGLSFAVPVPLIAADGATVVRGEVDGEPVTASLSREGLRVTAVLDFEVAGPGYRAMDLAAGLWSFGHHAWPGATDALRRGYLARLPLTDAEQHAVPELQLLREATSLVHWYGRHLEGLTTAADISARADRLLRVERGVRRDA